MILAAIILGLQQGCSELGVMVAKHENPHFLCPMETHLDAKPNNYVHHPIGVHGQDEGRLY